jgi:hypothetical protein
MAHCIAKTQDGKRCTRVAVAKQAFCAQHLKKKSVLGKSRRLNVKKCKLVKAKGKSPFSKRYLKKKGVARKAITHACKH